MSSLFCAICPHDLHFNSDLRDLTEWSVERIKAMYAEHGERFETFNRRLVGCGSSDEYRTTLEFLRDPDTVMIHIDTPYAFSVTLFPYGSVFTTLFKGFMIGEDEREFIHDFREELYQLMRIFGCTEAIYLRQDTPACDMVEEGHPYSKAKEWLLARHSPAISDYSAASLRQLEMKSQRWFLDTFEDLKAQYGPGTVDDQHEAWYDL
jgi:hypothetical protein